MKLDFKSVKDDGIFQMSDFTCPKENIRMNKEGLYRIILVQSGTAKFLVDTVPITVETSQLIFLTPHNVVDILSVDHQFVSVSFTKEFYCIDHHDQEVSCYGALFYGSSSVPVVSLDDKELRSIGMLFEVLKEEFEYKDHIQGEMLRMLLKRLLIKSSRLIRGLFVDPAIQDTQLDVVRQFNVLVEMHFRDKHQVKDYADLLFKSPKTLSNLFAQYNDKSPLQVINERIVLEAKRLLAHSEKTIGELSYELGYKDAAHFSKFFKKQVGVSPNTFKKSL